MTTLGLILTCILGVISVLLIIMILLQSDRAGGLGAISAGGDSYWSKNKGNSMEGALEKYTKIGGGLFLVIALLINFVA